MDCVQQHAWLRRLGKRDLLVEEKTSDVALRQGTVHGAGLVNKNRLHSADNTCCLKDYVCYCMSELHSSEAVVEATRAKRKAVTFTEFTVVHDKLLACQLL